MPANASPRDRRRGLVVALDGPSSSGKSSVGAAAALELGYRFCDTGLLYRAITWLVIRRAIDPSDVDRLVALVGEVDLAPDDRGRLARVRVAGEDVTPNVHGSEVDGQVSAVSKVPELRAALLERQRAIAAEGRIIVAGRDIGTVVLPKADVKIFLDASAEERARRRAEERGLDPNGPEAAEVLTDLRRRDELDSTRAIAPLRPAADAKTIVTDGNRFEETVALVVEAVRAAERARDRTIPATRTVQAPPAGERTNGSAPAAPPDARPDERAIDATITPLIRLVALGARVVARSFARVRIEGAIDAIPRTGPVILVANHASNADPVVIGAWLTPRLGRRIHWLGKRELFEWPVIGWVAANGGVHPVDRDNADLEAFRLARRILDEGNVLMVFPEGTRSPDGILQDAKDGVAMLALRTGALIVPIGMRDTDRFWPRGRGLPHIGRRIAMRVGTPFRVTDEIDAGLDRRAAKSAATAVIMARIAGLLPARQRGVDQALPAAREPVAGGA
ncbi:MAG TPA: (d)CMP kinase [Candidatus Limnocylindrales bacterium]